MRLWVTGLQCVPRVFVQCFLRVETACERSYIWVTFGGNKICQLSSKLRPAANGWYRAASHRHCSRPDSRSDPRVASSASPWVLEIKKCCNFWSFFDTPRSWRFDTEIGCFLFSACFIVCFSAECTRPTKSLAKYDQVLQLGLLFFPNRSGIRRFGSTNRFRDLVSIWLWRSEPPDVPPTLVAVGPAILDWLFQQPQSADESVPWTSLRLSKSLRYHESVRSF